MGLFSKKEYVCEKCGATFTARFELAYCLCKECWKEKCNADREVEEAVQGYIDYANKVLNKSYSTEEMYEISDYREALRIKNYNPWGISKQELQEASNNYKKLTDEEAESVIIRLGNSLVSSTTGAVYTGNFFVPTKYEGLIVDAESVFAVGFTWAFQMNIKEHEAIMCVVFTNDPYVPVFPVVYAGKKGLFELIKSKKGREDVKDFFEDMCPNLTYPVCDIKQLKKQLKEEGTVKGNIELKMMLGQIRDASLSAGIFDTEKMSEVLPAKSVAMLDEMNYMQLYEAEKILKMDKMFNKRFWNKHINNLSE